jgi:2-polyprenyl-6-methoxyphenol hydroxylase-like FAD-dependent oxidoreductase
MNFPRPLLVQTLLEGLGASKSKIRTGAGIVDVEMTKGGVRVRLSDGSVEEGSIVIGADGVHSSTRAIMQKLAKEAGQDFAKDEDPIASNYQIMVCTKTSYAWVFHLSYPLQHFLSTLLLFFPGVGVPPLAKLKKAES